MANGVHFPLQAGNDMWDALAVPHHYLPFRPQLEPDGTSRDRHLTTAHG